MGMNAQTGAVLNGLEHLRQSMADIVNTRIGTRVMRRDYGSNVPNIIDSPVNDDFAVDLYVAVAEALLKWEPRFVLREASYEPLGNGKVQMTFRGIYVATGDHVSIEDLMVS